MISLIDLEKKINSELTTKIKKLVETNKPVVAIASLESQTNQYQTIQNVLNQRYNVRPINLSESVTPEINAILMGGVSDSLSSSEKENLLEFLNRGGNLFLTQNRIKTNLQIQQAFPIESDIFSIMGQSRIV